MHSFVMLSVTPRTRRLAMAATAALALALAAPTAFAQPGGGMMHGGASIGLSVPQLLEEAKASLNLDTSQQVMWDTAVTQSKGAHEQGRANRQRVKEVIKTELAKAEPDLEAIAAAADAVEEQNRALRQQARAPWLTLYAHLTPGQKAVVRDLLQKRLDRAQSFRAGLVQRIRDALRPAG